MGNRSCVALAVALILGFTVADAQARPGGRRGGGQRAGGARAAKVRPANPANFGQGRRPAASRLRPNSPSDLLGFLGGGNVADKVSSLKTNFTPANQPFTPAWYANHPRAWQYTHPHADAWAIATLGTATAWLGINAAAAGNAGDSGTVYTAETEGTDDASTTANSTDTDGEFLPLGVFAIAPAGQQDASAVVQLAVDRQGTLRGNYYDVLTGSDQPVTGTLDKNSQQATFSVPQGNVTFQTTLTSLTRPTGTVTLHFASGGAQKWTLARFDNPAPAAPATKP